MNFSLALFDSTRAVIKAERLCKSKGIACKIIPVPHDLSAECGMALSFKPEDYVQIEQLFREEVIVARFFERK